MVLTQGQKEELELLLERHGERPRVALRVRVILALASGMTYSQIKRELRTTGPTISRWKRRFSERGIAGLAPLFRGAVRKKTTEEALARLREHLRKSGPRLSVRELARTLGVSKSTVQRLLQVINGQRTG